MIFVWPSFVVVEAVVFKVVVAEAVVFKIVVKIVVVEGVVVDAVDALLLISLLGFVIVVDSPDEDAEFNFVNHLKIHDNLMLIMTCSTVLVTFDNFLISVICSTRN